MEVGNLPFLSIRASPSNSRGTKLAGFLSVLLLPIGYWLSLMSLIDFTVLLLGNNRRSLSADSETQHGSGSYLESYLCNHKGLDIFFSSFKLKARFCRSWWFWEPHPSPVSLGNHSTYRWWVGEWVSWGLTEAVFSASREGRSYKVMRGFWGSLGWMLSRQPSFCLVWYWLAPAAALLHPWGWCSLPRLLSSDPCCEVLSVEIKSPDSKPWLKGSVCVRGRIPPLPRHYVSSSSFPCPPALARNASKNKCCLFVCIFLKLKIGKLLCLFFFLTKQMFHNNFSLLVESPYFCQNTRQWSLLN